jgi:hypothetical protein
MALSRLSQYDATYTAQDDDRALEAAGHEWASANGYDIPYDVAGCVGRLQVLGGKRKVYDARRRRQVVQWTAVDEMRRICEPFRRDAEDARHELPEDEVPEDELVEPAPVDLERASAPERKRRLGVKVERLLMRQKNEEQQRALRQ